MKPFLDGGDVHGLFYKMSPCVTQLIDGIEVILINFSKYSGNDFY